MAEIENPYSEIFNADQLPLVLESAEVKRTMYKMYERGGSYIDLPTRDEAIPLDANILTLAAEMDTNRYYAIGAMSYLNGTVRAAGKSMSISGVVGSSPLVFPNARIYGSLEEACDMNPANANRLQQSFKDTTHAPAYIEGSYVVKTNDAHDCVENCENRSYGCGVNRWKWYPAGSNLLAVPQGTTDIQITKEDGHTKLGRLAPYKTPVEILLKDFSGKVDLIAASPRK